MPLNHGEMQDLLWSLKFLDLNFNDHFHYKVRYFTENLGVAQRNLPPSLYKMLTFFTSC
jgi:hypothetical protein